MMKTHQFVELFSPEISFHRAYHPDQVQVSLEAKIIEKSFSFFGLNGVKMVFQIVWKRVLVDKHLFIA